MAETIDYQKRCEHYERILGIGEYDPVKSAFIVLVKMLNQQAEFLNGFKINSCIGENDKESPKYKRAMDMLGGLPKLIGEVNDLRGTLKLTKTDIAEIEGNKAIFSKITTPESIANATSNPAGQVN